MTSTRAVADAIKGAAFGPGIDFKNLTVIPIIGAGGGSADYLTLDEGLAAGLVEVTEVSEAGHVPELKVTVKGAVPVLLVDGEELIGAKQNRVLNLTILAPAQRTTVIPVSCVEAGRWRRLSSTFASATRTHFAEGRAEKMRQVTASMHSLGVRRSHQGAVWDLIARKSARLQSPSSTSAMAAMYEKFDAPLDDFVRAFPPVDQQIGAVFLINGTCVGLECFDVPATWHKVSPKLIRSYAIDALDRQHARTEQSAVDADRFVNDISAATGAVFPAVGEGEDVRLESRDVIGAALVAHGRAIHISAFRQRPPG
jgi:hypothetical protein